MIVGTFITWEFQKKIYLRLICKEPLQDSNLINKGILL